MSDIRKWLINNRTLLSQREVNIDGIRRFTNDYSPMMMKVGDEKKYCCDVWITRIA